MRNLLAAAARICAALVSMLAVHLSVRAVTVAYGSLSQSVCMRHLSTQTKISSACFDIALTTGTHLLFVSVAWCAVFGMLYFASTQNTGTGWLALRYTAKYAGATAAMLLFLLWGLPVLLVFFMYIVFPIVLFIGAGIAALIVLLARLFG